MAEVKTTNAVNVIEVVQAGPRGPIWSGEFSGSGNFTGSLLITGSLTVSGSGTLLNIGPFNNTGSIDSSGSINVDGSGSFIHVSSSGDILGANISSSNQIHISSPDPKLIFFDEGTIGQFKIYKSAKNSYLENTDSNLQDLYIRSYSDMYNIVVDGGNGNVGIGSEVDDKTSKLYVTGNIEATTNITASGNISASEDVFGETGSFDHVIAAGQMEAPNFVGNLIGNVVGSATGLIGSPSIDVTDVSASGDILFDGSSGTIIANKSLDFRFHKETGTTDTFKVTNEITGKTLFEVSELGLIAFGTTGVDANLTAEENMTFMLDYPGNNSTDLKYSWKNYTTTLMELSEGGDLDVQSGKIETTGAINGGTITAATDLIATTASLNHIRSKGDVADDTYIELGADKIEFTAGGVKFGTIKEVTQDIIDMNSGLGDVDFRINGNGSFNAFFVEASTKNIGINKSDPAEKLDVSGNISGSGNLVIDGNLQIDGSQVNFKNLPTSDPEILGRMYTDGTPSSGFPKAVMISGG